MLFFSSCICFSGGLRRSCRCFVAVTLCVNERSVAIFFFIKPVENSTPLQVLDPFDCTESLWQSGVCAPHRDRATFIENSIQNGAVCEGPCVF